MIALLRSAVIRTWALWAILLVYVTVPARNALLLTGIPFGTLSFGAAVVLIALPFLARPLREVRLAVVAAALLLLGLRLLAAPSILPTGWAATYYRNAEFKGNSERSTEFRDTRWTRIERAVDHVASTFPLHFFNDLAFNFALDRRAPPFSAVYRGYLRTDSPEPITINVTASNRFTVVANSRVIGTEPQGRVRLDDVRDDQERRQPG